MKILITGSTGFVGSHLVDRLTAQGHEVYSLYRNENKLKEFNIGGIPLKGDLKDFSWIKKLPENLDSVIHIAGLVHAPDISNFYKVNVKATLNLIENLKKRYSKLNFGFISSQASTGPSENQEIKNEDGPHLPVSHYGKSKLEAENKIKEMIPQAWKFFIIRPPMVIGPRDPAILEVFQIIKSGFMPVVGNPKTKMYSFVSVFDLVKGIDCALKKNLEINGETFYIASPTPISYQVLAETISKAMGKKAPKFIIVPGIILKLVANLLDLIHKLIPSFSPRLTKDKVNEILPNFWVINSEKSVTLLGMEYDWSLQQIIETTLEDYLDRKWL